MDVSDLFTSDPFLSFDNDLNDVTGKQFSKLLFILKKIITINL